MELLITMLEVGGALIAVTLLLWMAATVEHRQLGPVIADHVDEAQAAGS